MRSELLVHWAAVVAWAVAIWVLGGDGFSNDSTSRLLRPLLEALFPALSPEGLDAAHFVIRKSSHVLEYGVFTLLALRALRVTRVLSIKLSLAVAMSLALTLAISDESRQVRSNARDGAWTDVLLDTMGAGGGLLAAHVLPGWSKRYFPPR